jgi:hypothetical protein
MRVWGFVAVCALAMLGCDRNLSKVSARALLAHDAPLTCEIQLPGMVMGGAGVVTFGMPGSSRTIQYDPTSDYSGCADRLEAAGLLTGKQCGTFGKVPFCTARLTNDSIELAEDGKSLRYKCGTVDYTIESVTTEGAHATVHYTEHAEMPLDAASLGLCSMPMVHEAERTFTASRDDDGRWTVDKVQRRL